MKNGCGAGAPVDQEFVATSYTDVVADGPAVPPPTMYTLPLYAPAAAP
jgi:hypothetical protein